MQYDADRPQAPESSDEYLPNDVVAEDRLAASRVGAWLGLAAAGSVFVFCAGVLLAASQMDSASIAEEVRGVESRPSADVFEAD